MNPLTNPPSNTADAVMAEVADPLDALLRQIVAGYFVLTDGQGSVSKWSEPAELLFGQPAEDILGKSFFETLIGGQLPPAGQAWREFLDLGEPPRVPGSVALTGRCSDGDSFPMEAVFVPVKLDEGFDFSLFLEDLSFELPLNLMLLRMRQQHPVVVRALRSALETEVAPWEGWRTAGTLVVFKPLSATPWIESELARRQAAREVADAEAEERLTNFDPGIQGGFNELDDAAAVVARLLSAVERIDELERVAGGPARAARRGAPRGGAPCRRVRSRRRGPALRSPACAVGGSERARPRRAARPPRAARARPPGRRVRRGRAPPGAGRRRVRLVAPGRPARPARARPRVRRVAGRFPPGRGRVRRRGARDRRDRRVRPPLRGPARRWRRHLRPARAGPRRARGGRAGRPRRARRDACAARA